MKKRIFFVFLIILLSISIITLFSINITLTKAYNGGSAEGAAAADAAAADAFGGDGGGDSGGGDVGVGDVGGSVGGDTLGDGICSPTEGCSSAPQDCGSCCVSNIGTPCNCGTIDCAGNCINQVGSAATETLCADGIDNDCDGLTDCNDNDCDGSITGTVKNHDGQAISSADVSAKKDLTLVKSATTNQQGSYTILPINCGTYNLVASHPDYASRTKSNIIISPQQQTISNFEGSSSLFLGTSCEQDCTFAVENIVHASCDGENGCAFYDSIAKAACDNSQPGWVRDYDSSHYVVCASGAPQPKVETQANVRCASGTLVKITKIVLHNGKPVRLIVAMCG